MASLQMSNTSKRPRLSLQIKTACNPPSKGLRGQPVDPSDPTTFNTMSNIYITAIERSSALPALPALPSEPIAAIDTCQNFSLQTPVEKADLRPRVETTFVPTYPETPLTAQPMSPQQGDLVYPSTMTATPPLSAGAVENATKVFTFSSADTSADTLSPPSCQSIRSRVDDRTLPRRRAAFPISALPGHMPYTHPRSLHSILRNSPLPPRTAIPPPSPRHQSLRLQAKAAKKVEYNSPLEEEITTSKYTRSHIDLLAEDGSPLSPSDATLSGTEPEATLDIALAFTANEIQDGGQTPGPIENMRRKMAGLAASSPVLPSTNRCVNRKRKRTEKKRHWVWTIGQEEDDDEVGGAIAALGAQTAKRHSLAVECDENLPTQSIESSSTLSVLSDVEMSDSCSNEYSDDHKRRCLSVPLDAEAEVKTPTAPQGYQRNRDPPVPELAGRQSDGRSSTECFE